MDLRDQLDTRPMDFSNRARRTTVEARLPDEQSMPRFRSVFDACTPSGAK